MGYPPRFADELERALQAGLAVGELDVTASRALQALLAHPRFAAAARLLFTGSGDSLFAALAALPALRRWAGRPAQVLTSLEFARYEVPLLGPHDVAIAVSNSGNSTRTRETVILARERGALTVAVTGAAAGPLAGLVDVVLARPVRAPEGLDPSYGRVYLNWLEYLATLVTLALLGLALGEEARRLTSAERAAARAAIEHAVAGVGGVARAIEPAIEALARELGGVDTLWVVGGGPNRGTAEFSAAKLHEQVPVNGIPQDLEEWAHTQYFLTLSWRARSVVLVLAAPGNALDRAEELVEGVAGAGGRAIVVARPGHGQFPRAHVRIDLPGDEPELLTPFTYHVPGQLLALHLARRAALPLTPLRRQDDYWLIRKGALRSTAAGLA
jgi:glucosamine--fructose-6-phosphate aminotransferase (isomerizing)